MTKGKLILGFGINDADYRVTMNEKTILDCGKVSLKRLWTCAYYDRWHHMIGRCYSEKAILDRPSYTAADVTPAWSRFSDFKVWMEGHDWRGKHLDKDLLFPGNKTYSPETCYFIDPLVNGFITEKRSNSGLYPAGVNYDRARDKFAAKCSDPFTKSNKSLGRFNTVEQAHQAWLSCKLEFAYRLAEMQDDPVVAQALISRYENYKGE